MERLAKRVQELETSSNNIKLLTEMMNHHTPSSPPQDKELMKVLKHSFNPEPESVKSRKWQFQLLSHKASRCYTSLLDWETAHETVNEKEQSIFINYYMVVEGCGWYPQVSGRASETLFFGMRWSNPTQCNFLFTYNLCTTVSSMSVGNECSNVTSSGNMFLVSQMVSTDV